MPKKGLELVIPFGPEETEVEIHSYLTQIMKNVSKFAENFFPAYIYQNFSSFSPDSFTGGFGDFNVSAQGKQDEYSQDSNYPKFEQLYETIVKVIFALTLAWLLNRALIKIKFLGSFLEILLSWTVVLFVSPICLICLLPMLLFRFGLSIYLQVKYQNKIFLADPLDANWAYEKYASSSTCIGMYVVEGNCDLDKIRRRFQRVVDFRMNINGREVEMYDRLRHKIVNHCGYICWELLDHFDIKNHVKFMTDSSPHEENEFWSEERVFAKLSSLQDVPFENKNLSPWEVLVVPKFLYKCNSSKPHYVIIVRISHSIMDGVSSGNALHAVIADEPFKFSIDPINPLKISQSKLMFAHFLALLNIPRITMANLLLKDSSRFHSQTLMGQKTMGWSRAINMQSLKSLKNSTNTSIFSVLISCLGGSMRSLFLKYGDEVPEKIWAAPPFALLPYADRRPRNRFSVVLFPLQIGLKTFEERLRAVAQASKAIASSSDILSNFYIMNLLGMLPFWVLKILAPLAHATLSLSNMPGPVEEVKIFEGDPIVDIGAWIPIKNTIGIGMALFSYADRIRVTFVGDRASLPHKSDLNFLKEKFEEELEILAKSVKLDPSKLFIERNS